MGLIRYIKSRCTVHDNTTIALEEEDVYRILSSRRRRLLLLVLDERDDDEVTISELARAVASRDTGAEPLDVPNDTYERIYVSLYQSHVPALAEADVVSWDRDAGIVRCGPSFPGLADVILDVEQRLSE